MHPYDRIVVEWMDLRIPPFFPREIQFDPNVMDSFIVAVIGPRRAGKTYFMYQTISALLENGVKREDILYINLEDDRLFPLGPDAMDGILESFDELYGEHEVAYLFLDEIQNLTDWQLWLKRVHALRKNIRIVISGSSAKLLSREIVTGLRGRVFSVEVLPVSFREYVRYKGNNPDSIAKRPYGSNARTARRLFREYLRKGGYPAIAFSDMPERASYEVVQSYYETMILRDVMERHGIRETAMLKNLSKMLLTSVGSEFSYPRLYNNLKAIGFSPSKSTVIEYVSYMEEAYLFFVLKRWRPSEKKRQTSPMKPYVLDTSLLDALVYSGSEDRGKRLENIVFIELMRRKKKVFYHRNGEECDFLTYEGEKIREAIQVTESLEENTEREIKGLREAMKAYSLSNGLILTENEADEMEGIEVMPVWLWLLRK